MVTVTGGGKFDRAMSDLARKLDKRGTLEVGFFADAKYPDGTLVALVAVTQNYGSASRGIPPRPFFTNAISKNSPRWGSGLINLLKSTDGDVERSLSLMGEGIKGQIQQEIVDTNAPPLAPATIARKGFAKPLIDTGQMQKSVGYQVDVG
jgi:hypothetical protein